MTKNRHSTAHYVLEKDDFVEGEETIDSAEWTRNVVEALQEDCSRVKKK